MQFLKTYVGDLSDLALDFTTTRDVFGQTETVELKPGGQNIPVTAENCVEYMYLLAHYKLNRQVRVFSFYHIVYVCRGILYLSACGVLRAEMANWK